MAALVLLLDEQIWGQIDSGLGPVLKGKYTNMTFIDKRKGALLVI